MKKILEYNYYLFAEKFTAIEKEKVITFVTIVQYLFMVNFTLFILLFFTEPLKQFPLLIIIFCLVTFFALRFYNRKKYRDRYFKFKLNWNNEDEKKKSFYKKLIWTLVGFKPHLVRAKIITEARSSFQLVPKNESKQYKLLLF
jgi:glucan phosphoethanolaminetransferase (alkaline phosphatase superfamily)